MGVTFKPCSAKSHRPIFQCLEVEDGQKPEWLEVKEWDAHGECLTPSTGESPSTVRESSLSQVLESGGGAVEVLFKPESVRRDSSESESKGQDAPTGTVPCASGTGRGVCKHGDEEKPSKLLTLRSGCEGGGKGPLVQDELSGTLNTHNTQTLFCKSSDVAFVGNLQVDSTKVKNKAGALNCMHQVGCVMVRGGGPVSTKTQREH